MERTILLLREYGLLIVTGIAGIGLLIYGLWPVLWPEPVKVEIISGDTVTQCHGEGCGQKSIFVDVAGAVEKPGVYQLPDKSRIGDALVMAHGLSADANREWVAQNLNLAQEVKDGAKIYIPRQSENPARNAAHSAAGGSVNQNFRTSENQIGKVNINTASMAELDGLEGIGEVRAKAIVANRPYGSTEELVSKAKIPPTVYDKIKELVSVY